MNNDPWELLREARDRLSLHMETYFSQQKGTMFLTIGLVERIDAVLAARDAGMNCGKGCPDCGHPYGGLDYCQGSGHKGDI